MVPRWANSVAASVSASKTIHSPSGDQTGSIQNGGSVCVVTRRNPVPSGWMTQMSSSFSRSEAKTISSLMAFQAGGKVGMAAKVGTDKWR